MKHFLVQAFGSAHAYTRDTHQWVGAASREDGDAGSVALFEHEGRPIVAVCGGWLYPRTLSHRAVDISRGQVLWAAEGTASTGVVPIRLGERTVLACSTIGKWGNSSGVRDPLTGAPLRERPAGFQDGGRLVGSSGGRLYAFVDSKAGTLRVYRDGAQVAALTAPTDPAPVVSTFTLGGTTYTATEAAISFSQRMAVHLDDDGGILTAQGPLVDAYGPDGAHTHRLQLPEGTTVSGASWVASDGWLLLLTSGEQAAACRLRDGATLMERPASRHLGFAYGAVLREGTSLTDARTGAALPPLPLPALPDLLGRLEIDAPGTYGDRMVQIASELLGRNRISVDPMLRRFNIVPKDVRRPARRTTISAGPLPATREMRRALAALARWSGGRERVAMTARALSAHDARLDVPLPSEAMPLFASGLPHLMAAGHLHPDRRARLLSLTDDIPEDLTPLAAFSLDKETEIVVTWAYRYTAGGVEFFRVESVWGRRGEGIRAENYQAIHVTGPLPLHTLVSAEAGRLSYEAHEKTYFSRTPDRPPVAVQIRLD